MSLKKIHDNQPDKFEFTKANLELCLLYTSDAADE